MVSASDFKWNYVYDILKLISKDLNVFMFRFSKSMEEIIISSLIGYYNFASAIKM